MGVDCTLRTDMAKFSEDTRWAESRRSFGNLFQIMDTSFNREASEQAIRRMGKFNKFKKEGHVDIKSFGIRYQK